MFSPAQTESLSIALLSLVILLAGCGGSTVPVTAQTQPLGAYSPVAAPTVVGPIEGGLRGHPWGGTVTALAPLTPFNFIQEEYFFSGSAQSRDHLGKPTGNTANYTSRMLVQRPQDPAAFNGTVLVEWFNDTAEVDEAVLWGLTHDELLREGYAWVGVSAQSVGVNTSPLGLKFWDPLRYAPLQHPGDAYEFDIYSQAARALFARSGPAPLGNLVPSRVIAGGESQSGGLLISYANQLQSGAKVFDGFLIHTWPGPISADVGVPVLMLLTEDEMDGFTSPLGVQQNLNFLAPLGDIPGLGSLRLPSPAPPSDDSANLRVWELAGGSHFDQQALRYIVASLTQDLTAPLSLPLILSVPAVCVLPPDELDLSRPTIAALHQLNGWIASGQAPPSQPRLETQANGYLLRDAKGFVQGGIRMPNYAVPVALNRGDTCLFFGDYEAFSSAEIQTRYPSAAVFRGEFNSAAAQDVEAGTLLLPEATDYIYEAESVDVWN